MHAASGKYIQGFEHCLFRLFHNTLLYSLPVFLTLIFANISFAEEQWAKTFGGSGREEAYSVEQTSDGGYIVAGYTDSFGAGNEDVWVMKFDASGNIMWQKTYGGTDSDWANSIKQTSDGGYIVAGVTYSFGAGSSDIWVLKLYDNGSVQWQNTYGGTDSDFANSVSQTSDGGYIVAGVTYSFGVVNADAWVLKLAANGTEQWNTTYGGAGNDFANSIQQTSDGGYIVAGDTDSFYTDYADHRYENRNVWVIKLNPTGGVTWERIYQGTSFDFANSVQQTSDGGYIVAGYTWSSGAGNEDVWILKLADTGAHQWQYTYGGAYNDWAYSARQTSDEGFIVVGVTYSFNSANGDIWILKLYNNGTIQWQKSYGGVSGDGAYSIRETSDGGYIVAGVTYSFDAVSGDFWILKLPGSGSITFSAGSGASQNNTSSTLAASFIKSDVVTVFSTLNPVDNVSNTFVTPKDSLAAVASQREGTCSFTLSSDNKSYTSEGGVDNVTVAASLGSCTWQATTSSSWITITSATNFTGSGTMSYSYPVNTGAVRTGAIILGGKTLSVTQNGCTFALTYDNTSFSYSSGTRSIIISPSSQECTWEVVNNSSWISITNNTSGSGSYTLGYSVSANTASSMRTANITVAGQTVTITQEAICSYTLSSLEQAFTSTGGSGSVNVTATPSNCSWSVSKNANWITLTSATSGTGNGIVTYTVAGRSDSGPSFSGALTIAGLTHSVTQSAATSGQSNNLAGTSGSGTGSTTVTGTGTTGTTGTGTTGSSTTGTGGTTGQTATVVVGADTPIFATASDQVTTSSSQSESAAKAGVSVPGSGCLYTLSSSSVSMGPAGGTGSVTVSVSSKSANACTWIASSGSQWISITGGGSGAGTGVVSFFVSPNNGRERTGSLAIAGQTIVVTQEELPCTYSINPQGQAFSSFKGSGSVVVAAFPEYCVWDAFSSDSWLSVSFGDKGMGNGVVYYGVAENAGSAARVGTIKIAGYTFPVTQEGVQCNFVLSKSAHNFGVSGGEGDVMVSTIDPKCPRDVVSNADWIKITSGDSGTGSGTIGFSVPANTGAPRKSTFTVSGRPFTVSQGSDCAYAISPLSKSFSLSGGSGEIEVKTSMSTCKWDAASEVEWITASGSDTGGGRLQFSVLANSGPPRTGTITVAGQQFTVTQGSDCGYEVSPTSQAVGLGGGTGTINIKTSAESCIRTALSNADWINVTSGSEEKGSGAITFSVAANSGPPRTGTISVADQLFTVTQGSECAYTVSPTSQSFSINGGSGAISIKASRGDCKWEVANSADWVVLTSPPAGRGSGIVRFTAISNTGLPRSSKIEVGGAKFAVSQEGCGYTVSPAMLNYPAGGGTASLSVKTTGDKCSREINAVVDWINIGSGKNELGSGSILVNVFPNKGPARSEQIFIGGQAVMIKQDSGCSFSFSSQTQSFGASGGQGSIFLKASSDVCIPQAVSGLDWIVIDPAVGEKSAGVVKYSVLANTTGKKREGFITVSGKRFVVIQDK
ncbi:MAG: BACON domain-containing protein [Nitrospirae bacterium]|nr:BACON domain-containing protein [Nitrospirota bacterium]